MRPAPPCVGWGPHVAVNVVETARERLCWACWARGYDLVGRAP